jgi:hypothetical protein
MKTSADTTPASNTNEQSRNAMNVYKAISAITAEMSKIGISKDSKNDQQGYKFRGIDAVYGALSPLLAKHGLCVLPRVVAREVVERQTRSGGALFYTTLTVEFDFVASEDGSKHTVCMIGEAMDSGDKSSNKAMSAAYKYACFQTFCIPTEGDNDADAHTHEVQAKVDTKVVNDYARRVMDAVETDNDDKMREILVEAKEAGQDFAAALWSTLPMPIKNYIRDHMKEAA